MVAIIRTEWSGTSGGPGLTQMAVLGAAGGDWNPSGANAATAAVRKFWESFRIYLPDELKLQVNPVIDVFDTVSGELLASHVATTVPAVTTGSGTTGYAGGVGGKVVWNTGQIREGRRVKGSTFIVPMLSSVFTGTGTIQPGTTTQINASATALIADLAAAQTSLAVWSRPASSPSFRAGFATQVVAGSMGQKSAILRGRRD